MHEMKGLIEAETEKDRAPAKVQDAPRNLPPPAITVHRASGSGSDARRVGFDLPQHDKSAAQSAQEQHSHAVNSQSSPHDSQMQSQATQHYSAHESHHSSEQASNVASAASRAAPEVSQMAPASTHHHHTSQMPPSVAHSNVAPPTHVHSEHAPHDAPKVVDFATQVTVVPRTSHNHQVAVHSPFRSPGKDEVFDPDALPIPHHDADKTPRAEIEDPFADEFTTLAAKLPDEVKAHPDFPYAQHSVLESVVPQNANSRPKTYLCDSIDSDRASTARNSQVNAGRHRAQPTMEHVMPPMEAGVDPRELQQRLAHLPADAPMRKGQHRPEPSLEGQGASSQQVDADKLKDRLNRVVVLSPRHHARVISLNSVEESPCEGEELAMDSTRATYKGSSRALQDGQDEYDLNDPDYDPNQDESGNTANDESIDSANAETLDTVPGSSKWGKAGNASGDQEVVREIKSALVGSFLIHQCR